MKKLLTLIMVVVAAFLVSACGSTTPSDGWSVEVSFDYQHQDIHGSNQYAVWIENDKGEVVRTLFVTSFTTKGRAHGDEELVRGYIKRPLCVPTWVKDVDANSLSDEQLDAFTGATPSENGKQSFVWDFKDTAGNLVPDGSYKVMVEATLFDESIITYSATFNTSDNAGELQLASSITKEAPERAGMIANLNAVLKK